MGLFLAALLASSLVILLLIVALQVRSRKREFAILLSMGEARGKVIGQICLEVLTVLLAAALLGGLVGSVLVAPAAERVSLSLLSDQVDNTQRTGSRCWRGPNRLEPAVSPSPVTL